MIVFDGVRKIYEPDVVALDDVSFVIDKGEFVFIVGASGSGKSTLVRLLLKEMEPTTGKIVVGGRDLTRLKHSKVPMLRRNVGCVFQDFKLLPNRTAGENIAYALRVQGESKNSIRRKVPEVMTLVGLADKMNSCPTSSRAASSSASRSRAPSSTIRRCSSATSRPATSIPTRPSASCSFYRINRSGTTILMVTHDREMVDKMRRRVIALEDGKLARDERRGGYESE